MLSAFTGLNTAKLGIMSHQKSLYTTGHNISNAETAGYSRQVVTSVSTPSISFYGSTGKLFVGTGTDISMVSRARDFLVDRQLWKQNSISAFYSNLNSVQSKMETIFTEPSETNFQAMLDNFWTSVQNVASNPADTGTRTTMRQSAVDLVDIIKTSASQLGDQVSDINDSIRKQVDRINQINEEILALNKQIVLMESGSAGPANDLRDKRDLLIDELSSYSKTNVSEDDRGNYIVSLNGQVVVSGTSTTKLEVYENKNSDVWKFYGYPTYDVRLQTNPPIGLNLTDGSLGGLIEARDSDKQGILSKLNMLNDISKALLCDFNQIHKEGLGLDNSTGLNFFGDLAIQYAAVESSLVNNPITGLPIGSDPGYDPVAAGVNNSEKNWISQLKVNDIYFDSISGLDKIAAKTLAGNLEIILSTTNRVNSVAADVSMPANQAKVAFVGESLMTFKGPARQGIKIEIEDMTDGYVTKAKYEFVVDGVTYTGQADCTNDTGRSVLRLTGSSPYEYNIQIAIDPKTDTNSIGVNDIYNMVLYPATGGSASLTNTPYTRYESTNQTEFTLVNANVNAAGEIQNLRLSLDGGKTEYDVTKYGVIPLGANADNTANIFTVTGVLPDGNAFTFQLEIKHDRGNTAIDTGLPVDEQIASGDKYTFKMPPSEAASDNMVRLAQFLKYGADDAAVIEHSMYMGDAKYKATLGKKSIDEEYNEGLGALGVQTQTSYSMWLNQATMVEQITTVRANYKDVSLDEELSNMIQFQKGYNSNARMLTAIDEMLDKLINGTGRVGL